MTDSTLPQRPGATPGPGPDASQEIRLGAKIGRFVVEGQLGAGAMGIVYAAHDRELDRRIALKVLKGTGEDPEALLRLQREGQAMARVTHPNVITVHEAGIQGRLVFLAQELLDGGSLRQWLEQPHSQREILDKFVAAGRGLAAAHAAGLVHRDFKPDNVLLGKDGRVRVSDFGLARSLAGMETVPARPIEPDKGTAIDPAKSPMATMTQTGAVMGTPLYMSPEQHRGEHADERSDQFSFCVALYESLYRMQPFPGKTAVALADAVMTGRMSPPPRNAKVSAHVRKVLLRGLATDPAKRYPSMDALLADLTHDPAARVRRWAFTIGALIVIAGAVIGGYVLRSKTSREVVPQLRTIAVMGFRNLAGDKSVEWMSSAVSSLIANELSRGDDVRVIPAEDVNRAKKELQLPSTDSYSKETLAKIRDRLGSDAVVTGSYLFSGDDITLTVVVEDLPRHKPPTRIELHRKAAELPALAQDAGLKIRAALQISSIVAAKEADVVLPTNQAAAKAFVEGTDALKRFDFKSARDSFRDSAQKQPDFAPTYIALADAYQGLFAGDDAKAAARKALETATSLNIDQQRLVMGEAYERLGDTVKAREQYKLLFATKPTLKNGKLLLGVEAADDFPATLASVRKLGADPQIDVIEARAELDKANAQHALELAQGAAKVAKTQGSLVEADARRVEGEAQLLLGNLGAAAEAFEAARQLYDDVGDVINRLAAIEEIGGVSLERGDLDDAAAKYDVVAKSRASAKQGDLAARAWAAEAYATALRGKIADAERSLKNAEDKKPQDPDAITQVDLAAAWIAWAKGDADVGLKRSEQCAARASSDSMHVLCLELNGQIRADRADPDTRKTYQEALDLAEKAQIQQRIDSVQLALAMLDLDDGQEALAIGEAQTVRESAAKRGATGLEAYAWIVLARAHIGQAASQQALDDLEHINANTPPQAIRQRVLYRALDGVTHYLLGDPDAAKTSITAATTEADKQGCPGLLYEARLARAQTLSGDDAKKELESIANDAKARNFGRIAKLAEAQAQP